MEKNNEKINKLLLGVILGGTLGAATLYLIRATQKRKTPVLQKIGKTIAEVGEMLENSDLTQNKFIKNTEKKLPNVTEVLSTITDWIDTGLTLWKNFKKEV